MDRVLIVGCPGAGKSTAARRLAAATGIPLVHLDLHYWLPGWVRPEPEDWLKTVEELIEQPRWIMDGNYGGTLSLRLKAADTSIHLDFSTSLCLRRSVTRALKGLGRIREGELQNGCPERLDWSFFRYVANYRRTQRALDLQRMENFGGNFHRFTTPQELERFLQEAAAGRS